MSVAVILGTRPETIKMAPVIKELERRCIDYFVLHTGQHYSYEMDQLFFEELEIHPPAFNLDAGSGSHAEQTGKIMTGIESILIKSKPDVVLVQGDTNTVLAGALAAAKLHIKVGHVEAGLRSYDRNMPEEINRVMADHLSDFLFATTGIARANLVREGIAEDSIFITGNTIVDSVYQNREIAKRKSNVLKDLGLKPKEYFLVTAHRAENVDDRSRLKEILRGLELIWSEFSLPIIFPVHPRTKKRVKEFGYEFDGINAIDPIGFLDFLQLEANAKLALTDSGGVQEETCILGVPCVTIRDNTERPETLAVKSNILVGANAEEMLAGAKQMLSQVNVWKNPFGDGRASRYIIDSLEIHNAIPLGQQKADDLRMSRCMIGAAK